MSSKYFLVPKNKEAKKRPRESVSRILSLNHHSSRDPVAEALKRSTRSLGLAALKHEPI